MIEELRKLVKINGVSGNEGAVREYIRGQILPFADKVYEDEMGNLVAVKRGDGPKVMLMAHMDEIGLVATYVDEKGFIWVSSVGGLSPKFALGHGIEFENGVKGILCADQKGDKEITLQDCYIDIGAESRDEALDRIKIGMTAAFLGDFFETGHKIVSPALDDRVGCYCLMETLRRLKNLTCELYVVFTVQEEVGLRGARVSGFEIVPDVAISVDVTSSGDFPGSGMLPSVLGKGTAIKLRDAAAISNREVADEFENLANRKGIMIQRAVAPRGGTDIGSVQRLGRGVAVCGLSIPIRYCHSRVEMVDKRDVEGMICLLTAYLEK